MTRAVLITGDYTSLLYGDKVPARGTAIMGRALFDDGKYLGRTSSTPVSAAIQTVLEPRGENVRIYYTREATR